MIDSKTLIELDRGMYEILEDQEIVCASLQALVISLARNEPKLPGYSKKTKMNGAGDVTEEEIIHTGANINDIKIATEALSTAMDKYFWLYANVVNSKKQFPPIARPR